MIPHSLTTLVLLLATSFLEIQAAAPNLDQLFQKQAAAHAQYTATARKVDIVILPTPASAVAKSIPVFESHPVPHPLPPRDHHHQDHHNAVKRFMRVKKDKEGASDLEVRADQYPLKADNSTSQSKDRTPSNDASASPIKGTYKGASSYYLFALNDDARNRVLDAMVSGGFKVVRIFVSDVYANNKGSDSVAVKDGECFALSVKNGADIDSFAVEPYAVGTYDDTILYKIDQLMLECSNRGPCRIISSQPSAAADSCRLRRSQACHRAVGPIRTRILVDQLVSLAVVLSVANFADSNLCAVTLSSSESSNPDHLELSKSPTRACSTSTAIWPPLSIDVFRTSSSTRTSSWEGRPGRGSTVSFTRSKLRMSRKGSVPSSFREQGEKRFLILYLIRQHMGMASASWTCDRSKHLKSLLPSGTSIKISSGGGITTQSSLGDWATSCWAIDVVSVHDYGTDAATTVAAINDARQRFPNKVRSDSFHFTVPCIECRPAPVQEVYLGEFGASGNNKAAILKSFVQALDASNISWMVWQVVNPGKGPADFEVSFRACFVVLELLLILVR